jgi:hypothetical protein
MDTTGWTERWRSVTWICSQFAYQSNIISDGMNAECIRAVAEKFVDSLFSCLAANEVLNVAQALN